MRNAFRISQGKPTIYCWTSPNSVWMAKSSMPLSHSLKPLMSAAGASACLPENQSTSVKNAQSCTRHCAIWATAHFPPRSSTSCRTCVPCARRWPRSLKSCAAAAGKAIAATPFVTSLTSALAVRILAPKWPRAHCQPLPIRACMSTTCLTWTVPTWHHCSKHWTRAAHCSSSPAKPSPRRKR